jgi:adenosylcobinamide-phosphate synthase
VTLNELQIVLAVLLDWLAGDPGNMYHPVRLVGKAANWLESHSRKAISSDRLAGIVTATSMVVTVFVVTSLITGLASGISTTLGVIVATIVIYTGIATRDLYEHAMNVYNALCSNDIKEARLRVGMICGRDTHNMDRESIIKATVESVAENLVDGVTCPLFYAFIGGPSAIMVYKAISTLDSMFGYKNDRYINFGWASAKLDDIAAFVPSRLTAIVIPLASWVLGMNARKSLLIFLRDRSKHPSPNAGQSESAFAGALGIQLGGPSAYDGVIHEKEFLGDAIESLQPQHIPRALKLMVTSMIIFCFMMLLLIAIM